MKEFAPQGVNSFFYEKIHFEEGGKMKIVEMLSLRVYQSNLTPLISGQSCRDR